MDRFTEGSFEQPCGKRLIVVRGGLSAIRTFVFGAVGQGLGRSERPTAGWAYRTLQGGHIRPACIAETRDAGIPDGRAAIGTGCGKNEVEDASDEIHMFRSIFKRQISPDG